MENQKPACILLRRKDAKVGGAFLVMVWAWDMEWSAAYQMVGEIWEWNFEPAVLVYDDDLYNLYALRLDASPSRQITVLLFLRILTFC
jgi:hypothetical protein